MTLVEPFLRIVKEFLRMVVHGIATHLQLEPNLKVFWVQNHQDKYKCQLLLKTLMNEDPLLFAFNGELLQQRIKLLIMVVLIFVIKKVKMITQCISLPSIATRA